MSKPAYDIWKVRTYSNVATYGSGAGLYRFGTVTTPDGIVEAYADSKCAGALVVHKGRAHMASWRHGMTKRVLVRAAAKFARDVVAGKEQP